MELERLAVALRPRHSWEAIDLGLRLVMLNARPLYAAWFAVTLPLAMLLLGAASLGDGMLSWAILAMWWLKPALDRAALFVVSRLVFGETPSVRETLRAMPGLLRAGGLLRGLTWARLSPYRAVTLPIDMLEGLRGKEKRQRKALMLRRISGAAAWLTIAWIHLEWLLWLGVLGLVPLVVPRELLADLDWRMLFGQGTPPPSWLAWALALLPLAASLIMEPLYIAAGFMLYIKRRTDLEAWDVELEFRRLAQSKQATSAPTLAALVCAACLALACLTPRPVWADEASLRQQRIERAEPTLKEVLKQPEFGREENHRSLHWRSFDWPHDSKPQQKSSLPGWLNSLGRTLAEGLEWVANLFAALGRIGSWLLIALIAAGLLYLVSRFQFSALTRAKPYIPPAELAGFDIRPQSLPADVAGEAFRLMQAGDGRAALSLLFRGTLSRLAHQEAVPFGRGDTEGDCLTRVRQHAPNRSGFVTRLLGCWQRLAYAHQSIESGEIELLCREWHREFGRSAAA